MSSNQHANFYADMALYISQNGTKELLSGYVSPQADLGRAAVYRNGYWRACSDALGSTFPSVKNFLGAHDFRHLAHAYTQNYPPTERTLTYFGARFVHFLRHNVPHSPHLCALAELDWAWLNCLFAEDATPVSDAQLALLMADENGLLTHPFRLLPNHQMVQIKQQIFEPWQALRVSHEATPNDLQKACEEAKAETSTVLFWRPSMHVLAQPLQANEAVFLSALRCSGSLGNASETTLKQDPNFDISSFFALLLQAEILQPNAIEG